MVQDAAAGVLRDGQPQHVDGLGPEARGAQLGAFFTDDVDVDLGRGAAPIRGRETVIGMAARLQPRTAAFRLRFEDVSVVMAPDGDSADVHLTAEFAAATSRPVKSRSTRASSRSGMRRVGAEWQIAKVTAVETLK